MLLGVVLQGYAGRLEVKTPVAKPFDAVIVPGCPTQADGGLTLSLQRRMTALGVPAERIYLEPHALHTEENIYNSLRIAQKMGWSQLGVASDRGQALGACRMLEAWHPQCGAFAMDTATVDHRCRELSGLLSAVRVQQVADFVPLKAREQARAQRHNRRERPPSLVLYPLMLVRHLLGRAPWQPFFPEETPLITWAEQSARYLRR